MITDVKMTGMSLKGASRLRMDSAYSFMVLLVLFSMRSHLLTATTQPLLFLRMRLKMAMSWASTPYWASIIRMQTSECSMARMALITE